MRTTLSARVFDPLWLLARQWQVGEFQAEDVGTPVLARVRATTATLSRCHLGELPADTPTQARRLRRAAHAARSDGRAPARATGGGERRAHAEVERRGRAAFPAHARVAAAVEELSRRCSSPALRCSRSRRRSSRPPTSRPCASCRRWPAARSMHAGSKRRCRASGASQMVLDPALEIVAADRAEVEQTRLRWLAWYDSVFSEPAGAADAWIPPRMEYAMSVAGRGCRSRRPTRRR